MKPRKWRLFVGQQGLAPVFGCGAIRGRELQWRAYQSLIALMMDSLLTIFVLPTQWVRLLCTRLHRTGCVVRLLSPVAGNDAALRRVLPGEVLSGGSGRGFQDD